MSVSKDFFCLQKSPQYSVKNNESEKKYYLIFKKSGIIKDKQLQNLHFTIACIKNSDNCKTDVLQLKC